MTVWDTRVVRRDLFRAAAASAMLVPLATALAACAGGAPEPSTRSPGDAGPKRGRMGSRVGDIEVFRDPSGMVDAPTGIIGAGGGVWFTSIANGRIGQVSPASGRVETFADPAGNVRLPANIYPAADGRVWFTCLGSNRLGALDPGARDPAATITTYTHPDLIKPVAMKASADGRLWFSLRGSGALGSVDPRADEPMQTLRVYHSDLISDPSALFIDRRERVWWVNGGNHTIGHLDSAADDVGGSVTTLGPWPSFGSPRAWAMDPAGRLWVTTQERPGLLTFDPSAPDPATTVRWITDSRLGTPDGVWFGVDGAVWFVDTAAHDRSPRPGRVRRRIVAIRRRAARRRRAVRHQALRGPPGRRPLVHQQDGELDRTDPDLRRPGLRARRKMAT